MSKVTAILLAYYPERVKNISFIINALKNGTRPPDEIVVLCNRPDLNIDGVLVRSDINLGNRARYPFALTIPSDYYFFIDDDVAPRDMTIDNFLSYNFDGVLGHCGKITPGGNYSTPLIWADRIKEEKDVDLLIGIGSMFASFNAIVNMLILETTIRNTKQYNNGREGDIILSMANNCKVVTADSQSMTYNLDDGKVGMYLEDNHVKMRKDTTKSIYDARHRTDFV
ncbi:MAG: hypothetical protein WC280_02470 [Patescibacteria group bacterium]